MNDTKMSRVASVYEQSITVATHCMRKIGLEDTPLDPDSDFMITADQAIFMCRVSYLGVPVGYYAMYRGYYDLSLVPLGVFVTSLTYWHYPIRSWRRTFDITYVVSSIFYNIYRVSDAPHAVYYYIVLSIALACYPLSCHLYPKHIWLSVLIHGMLHVFAQISNVILYSGSIKPFTCVYNSSHAMCM
jgi:hypothetical protein